jgi:hypothetical protein
MENRSFNDDRDPNSNLFSLIKTIFIYRSVKKIIVLALVLGFVIIMALIGVFSK